MNSIHSTFTALENAVRANAKKALALEKELMQLSSISRLLSLSAIPPSTSLRLSTIFRKTLTRFYYDFPSHALLYALSILQHIDDNKIETCAQSSDVAGLSEWQGLQASLISGIHDFIDEQSNLKAKTVVANMVLPVLCPLYIDKSATRHLWTLERGWAVTICNLLNAITIGNGATASQLRQRIGGSRIGEILSKVQDLLVLEAVLILFGYLTPPLKMGREPRSTFIKEVFNKSIFPAHDRIISLAESSATDEWDDTLIKIMAVMADQDISLPQPFDIKEINVNNTLMSLEPPFYVDKNGFSVNYELANDTVEILEIPFSALKIVRCNVEKSIAAINLELLRPLNVRGKKVGIETTPDTQCGISFSVSVIRLPHFIRALKHRKVNVQFGQSRFSTAGKEINLDIPLVREDSKAFSKKRIEQFAQTHLEPSTPPSLEYVGSPCNALEIHSSPLFDKQCPVVPSYEPTSVPPVPASPISITSDDEAMKPINPRPKHARKQRTIVISEDEGTDAPPQKISKNDGGRHTDADTSTSTAKGRTTRSAAARGKQAVAATKAASPIKRKRVEDSDDENDSGSDMNFEQRPMSSPNAKKAQLKTYRKKAKTAPDHRTSPAVNFDELPKTKRAPVTKVPAKPKAPSKPDKVQRAVKKAPPSTRQPNKKNDVKIVVEETRPISISDNVAEEETTSVELNDMPPIRPRSPAKPIIKDSSPLPPKITKPKKAPWEDMDLFRASSSEGNVLANIMDFTPSGMDGDQDSDNFDPAKYSMLGDRYVDFAIPIQQCSTSTDTDAMDTFMADTTVVDPATSSPPKRVWYQSPVHAHLPLQEKTTSAEIGSKPPVLLAAKPDRDHVKTEISTGRRPSNEDKPERMTLARRHEHLTEQLGTNQRGNPPPSPLKTITPINVSTHNTRPKPCGRATADSADAPETYSVNRAIVSVDHSEGFESSNRSRLRSPMNSHPGRRNNDHALNALVIGADEHERPRFEPANRSNDSSPPSAVIYKRKERVEVHRSAQNTTHKQHRGRARAAPQKPPPDHMDKITEVLKELNEAIIDKIRHNFKSVTVNLAISQQAAVLHVVDLLVKMQSDRGEHFNELLEGAKSTKGQIDSILKGGRQAHLASVHSLKSYKEIIEDHDRRTLSKRLPPKLVPKPPPTVAKFLK